MTQKSMAPTESSEAVAGAMVKEAALPPTAGVATQPTKSMISGSGLPDQWLKRAEACYLHKSIQQLWPEPIVGVGFVAYTLASVMHQMAVLPAQVVIE